jgi:hypothetical protein
LGGRGAPPAPHVEAIASWAESLDIERRFIARAASNALALSEGRYELLVADGVAPVREAVDSLGPLHEAFRIQWPDTLQAAIATDRLELADELLELLESVPRGLVSPYLRAELHRGRGLVAAAKGAGEAVESELRAAIDGLRELGYPYALGRAEIDLAEWLIDQGRHAEAAQLLTDAVARVTPLRAAPLLARASELLSRVPAATA